MYLLIIIMIVCIKHISSLNHLSKQRFLFNRLINHDLCMNVPLNYDTNLLLNQDIKPNVIFVLGGPGAGKGTQCEMLSNEYGIKHLSAGELLRNEMNDKTSTYSELLDNYLRNGQIVPVKITLELLKRQILSTTNRSNRFLIDGFPRNWDNVQGWEEMMSNVCNIETVLFIDCPEDILESRLLNRGLTSGRSDDNIEAAKKRFLTFQQSTLPVVDYYNNKQLVKYINGNQTMSDVFLSLKNEIIPLIEKEIYILTYYLLKAIDSKDWSIYSSLTDDNITAFESEAKEGLVKGFDFHKQFFDEVDSYTSISTMVDPNIKVLGKSAVITYIRNKKIIDENKQEINRVITQETRIWNLIDGQWKQIHFHRNII